MKWMNILLLAVFLALTSCKHYPDELLTLQTDDDNAGSGSNGNNGGNSNSNNCDPDTAYFQNNILPLFVSNCAKSGCHDAVTAEEYLVLDSYSNIMASGEIQPFDASEGDIMEAITATDPDDIMPPPGHAPLSQQQINQIALWINQGAQNNSCSACDTVNVTYTAKIKPILDLKCKGCHSGANPGGGISIISFSDAQAIAQNGSLMHTINHDPNWPAMPKNQGMMPQCEVDAIRIWVDAGAPNN